MLNDDDSRAHSAEAIAVPAIDEGGGCGLGQAVAFQNQQAEAMKELSDLGRERRAP